MYIIYYWWLVRAEGEYQVLVYLTIVCTHEKNKTLGSGMLLSVTTEYLFVQKLILWFAYHIVWKAP